MKMFSMGLTPPVPKISDIFLPYASERRLTALRKNSRFSYYTSSGTALSVLRNSQLWARDSSLMNDYLENEHGYSYVIRCLSDDEISKRLSDFLRCWSIDLHDIIAEAYSSPTYPKGRPRYVTCFTEHSDNDANEDSLGRLSMWRAYGGAANVAIVFKGESFFVGPGGKETLMINPVLYALYDEFRARFIQMLDSLEVNYHFISDAPSGYIKDRVKWALDRFTITTKHPGFSEEREWRICITPDFFDYTQSKSSVEIIDRIPQHVWKLPMVKYENGKPIGSNIPDVLERVIIGPTPHPEPIKKAFADVLNECKVENYTEKVLVSGIPLRR